MQVDMHVALAVTNEHDVTLGELYERLALLSKHIHDDNRYGSKFPVTMRMIQLSSINTLVRDIEQCLAEIK